MKILYVDDERISRRNGVGFFREQGHSGYEAGSEPEAVRPMEAASFFDAAIVDYQLPNGFTGIDLLKRFDEMFPETTKILITGLNSDAVRNAAATIGAVFVAKPFLLEDLLQTIKEPQRLLPAQ
jgi:CheY-like chemotaxis protein